MMTKKRAFILEAWNFEMATDLSKHRTFSPFIIQPKIINIFKYKEIIHREIDIFTDLLIKTK